MRPSKEVTAAERLIVALDVPTRADAETLVDALEGTVSFYKVGLLLLMSGGMQDLLERLLKRGKVFLDLKLPNDITETVRSAVEMATSLGVSFLTLSNSVTAPTIAAAVAGRGASKLPQLLFVPLVSSMGAEDLAAAGETMTLEQFVSARARAALDAGCDGLIASGDAISQLRREHPEFVIVSPGIRPAGSSSDDHKRLTTPSQAISMGADYLVVGRPVRKPPAGSTPRDVARAIIEEIGAALG